MNTANHAPESTDSVRRLGALEAVYGLYDEFVTGLRLACRQGCAHCCTANVTLTSLEARYLADFLSRTHQAGLLGRLTQDAGRHSHNGPVTTNALARLCAEGKTPLEEPETLVSGRCPFLAENTCRVYAARPFGCRCLVSTVDCGTTGYATVDDFTLSLNTVFLQCIEHLDAGGFSGNLAVILDYLAGAMDADAEGSHRGDRPPALTANSPLTILMVPPEHRAAMTPWLEKLRQAMVLRHPSGTAETGHPTPTEKTLP